MAAAKPKTAKPAKEPKTQKTPRLAKPGKEPKTPDLPKEPASETKIFNTPMDDENRKLFLGVHLPEIKKLREKLATANSNLRNAYKTAKAEGQFTKADFDTAIALEDEEKEARAKARIARQLVIARYMGKSLGAQLELFLEPDRTPASDIAFDEGKMDALAGKPAKPNYDPSTEQHRRYMEGYHATTASQTEKNVKGIKPLHPEVAKDAAAVQAAKDANAAQRQGDAAAFEGAVPPPALKETTSGVPTSRAQFLAQQQKEKEVAEGSAFSKRN